MLENVLMAFLVAAGISIIAAVILALATHFFRVIAIEREKMVRKALPSVNCGACGFAGCDDYASAVANGEAEVNLCIPGGDDTAREISKIMGIEVKKCEKKVAFVNCNGNCNAAQHKAIYEGIITCRAESMIYGGSLACHFGCLGRGDCAKNCPVDAICIVDDVARVNIKTCIGCGMCVATCPKNLISMVTDQTKTVVLCNNKEKGKEVKKNCKNGCIACGICVKNCPENAITLEDNLITIDDAKCTGCGICTEKCPIKCIKPFDYLKGKIG